MVNAKQETGEERIARVKRMDPMDRFMYWIIERHSIYLKREAGKPKPWSIDPIFQTIFFTNPYRENDKVTKWFRENIRDPLKNSPDVLMATIIFRWFNRIDTGKLLLDSSGLRKTDNKFGLLTDWNESRAISILKKRNEVEGLPVFTSAFMIKVSHGPPGCKIPQVCECISALWKDRNILRAWCQSLEGLWNVLKTYKGLGGFLSYEIVTDLRHTSLLDKAPDINTWANPGPGASRGLNRLNGIPIIMAKGGTKDTGRKPPKDWQIQMCDLLLVVNSRLPKHMPRFELREVEHSLCEYDKMERVLFNQGKSKRRYDGT